MRWQDTQVYVLNWRLTSPPKNLGDVVYHAHLSQRKLFDGEGNHNGWEETSVCGRVISRSTFRPSYYRTEPLDQLHIRIAELFARPCKRCYEVEAS